MSTPVRRRSPLPTPDTEGGGEHHVRRPRRHHDRRRTAWLRWQGLQKLSAEAQDFAEFALKWAPFGGAPVEETFLRFGMTNTRFTERLWQLVYDGQISAEMSALFAASFPTPGPPQTTSAAQRIRGAGARRRTTRAATPR